MSGIEIALAIGIPALTTVLGWYGKVLYDNKKLKSDAALSANDQAFLMYKNLVEKVQKDFDNLTKQQNELEVQFLAAREALVELRVINKYLKEENEGLDKENKDLKTEIIGLKAVVKSL